MDYEKIRKEVEAISNGVIKDVEKELREYLDKCGLFYKCFVRVKSGQSLCKKLEEKISQKGDGYKLQDLIGIRIAVYFKEDIRLCEKLIQKHYKIVDVSKDDKTIENFGPQRINYVCKMSETTVKSFNTSLWSYPIDKTFEIQIRTVFSEGWHELEHDFRYKCKEDWDKYPDLSRTLNGIFATLDNCDWAIDSLFTQVAYQHYKNKEWIPMLRNVFRMRICDCCDLRQILEYFDDNPKVAKQFFRLDREEFLTQLSDIAFRIPLQMKNIIFLANLLQIHDEKLTEMTPTLLKEMVGLSGYSG